MEKHLEGRAKTDGEQAEFGIAVQEFLLPPPDDLAKFKEIDASIVAWIMQHATKEQDSRIELDRKELDSRIELDRKGLEADIKFDSDRIELAKEENGIVKASLWLAFSVVVLFIILSGVLIFLGMEIAGTVFGGAALILCVQAFLKFGRNQKQ
ncbi:MAG: DUF2335 domain-containing protein [Fibromonadales bacterium]|nr:DUF2335 domain-containing protein [Fibromonadales bacterium]